MENPLTMKEVAQQLLENRFPTEQEEDFDALTSCGIPLTGAAVITYALAKKCAKGDVSAIKLLLELVGETERAELGTNVLGEMTDAELLAIIKDEGLSANTVPLE